MKSTPRRAALLATSALLIAGYGAVLARPDAHERAATLAQLLQPTGAPALAVAERDDRDLGPVAGTRALTATLTLRQRNQVRLNSVLAQGGRVTPGQWAVSYGPSRAEAAVVQRALARYGIASSWQPGEVSLTVSAPAAALERFFRVHIDQFAPRTGRGGTFYAPTTAPAVPPGLAHEVAAVTGLDDYQRPIVAAIAGANGVTMAQMTTFYNLSPLRDAGLDGKGMTVLFPEWAIPDSTSLKEFATRFGLPAFNLTEVTDPSVWGAPATLANSGNGYYDIASEAAMDVEIVHGLAPGAKEIVYALGTETELPAMLKAMVTAHPGAIISSSISMHWCEDEPGAKNDALAEDAVFTQGAAEGMSIFFAAGDRGAYGCLPNSEPSTESELAVEPDASSPHVTSVGGTMMFLSSTGAYYKEAAWGEPIEQWGGGGGQSTIFPRPSWQTGPGTNTLTARGDPDVAADADIESGWDVIVPTQNGPFEGPSGGTSAATPFWAACTALIDEYLQQKGLQTVGFANPALYYFATSPKGLPAAPFHQITQGSNLHFQATAQWNEATGLGSPDVAHLADDFAWYDSTHRKGA
ncbi:MAG TPA: S53 family peptidase [Acidimicrobiales bacterium]|nr:S53 family peptidase [Acidimicrobiales bacterium]